MIRVFKSPKSKQVYIEGVAFGSPEDFTYSREGNLFTIDRINSKVVEVNKALFSLFLDSNNSPFLDADAFEEYLIETLKVETLFSFELAGFRCETIQNINSSTAGVKVQWDSSDRRVSTNITIDSANENIAVAGTPDSVEIGVNIKISIADTLNNQRPNQIIRILRSDGKIIASSATGYIRDASDHEESSYNLTAIDYSPIKDGSYSIVALRETTSSGVVSIDIDQTQLTIRRFN